MSAWNRRWIPAAWVAATLAGAAEPPARVDVRGNVLVVEPKVACAQVSVAVAGPDYDRRQTFEGCESRSLELGTLPDGEYRYELRLVPAEDQRDREPRGVSDPVVSGAFAVRGGRQVESESNARPARRRSPHPLPAASGVARPGPSPQDEVVADDLIVQGSGCFSWEGFECDSGETFSNGEDLKVKDLFPKFVFEDSGLPPSAVHDWEISTGTITGVEEFHVINIDRDTQPFTISGNAPSNSLFVDAQGDVGIQTATPHTGASLDVYGGDLFLSRADTYWRLYGRAGYFGIGNQLTSASPLPQFYLDASAAGSSLVIDPSSRVGLGATFPQAKLHVYDGGNARLRVEDGGAAAERTLLQLSNNGKTRFAIDNRQAGVVWTFNNDGNFTFSKVGTGVNAFVLDGLGNVTIQGTLTQLSDRDRKHGIVPVEPQSLLDRVARLPLATWQYRGEETRHIGPMAQDFHASFGFGADDKHIAPGDLAGVSLAAVQALQGAMRDDAAARAAELAALRGENARLAERLAVLEGKLVRD